MANYECPLAMLTRLKPAAVGLLSNQLKKKLREQHAAMVSEIQTEKEKNRDLVEKRKKEMASSRKAKHTMLSLTKKSDEKRLVTKEESAEIQDVALSVYQTTGKYGIGYKQRMRLLADFVKVAYGGELLQYLQAAYFTTLKFCPVNIAETIDISTGVINLNTVRAIRAMQPGIKKGEVGLLPSPSSVQRRQNKVKEYGMEHLKGCLDESERHLFRMDPKTCIPRFLQDFKYTEINGTADEPVLLKFTADGSPLSSTTGMDGAYSAEFAHVDPRLKVVQESALQSPKMAHPVIWGAIPDSKFDRTKYMLPFIKELNKIEADKQICIPCGETVGFHLKWAFQRRPGKQGQ